jgi:chemotaxis regulatin CheY-phosphate phosphatase CheZ
LQPGRILRNNEEFRTPRTLGQPISFRDSLRPTFSNIGENENNVQTQLELIMKMTNDAAIKVLSLAEKQTNAFKDFENEANHISHLINTMVPDAQIKDEFNRLSMKMKELSSDLEESNKHLLLSHTYQDLTDQMLQKMRHFIDSVEDGLTEIVKMLTADDIDRKLIEIDKKRIQNRCSQNEVDDLLDTLKF